MNHIIVLQRSLRDTDDMDHLKKREAIKVTHQIERQLPGGSWTLCRDGQKFKDRDAAWKLAYEMMAWRPGTRLRLRAFRTDPYESTTKYLYPKWIPMSGD